MKQVYVIIYFNQIIFCSNKAKVCYHWLINEIPTYCKSKLPSYVHFTRILKSKSVYKVTIADDVCYICKKITVFNKYPPDCFQKYIML